MYTENQGMAYQVPIISIRYARRFLRFLQSRGIHRNVVLEGSGISEKMLNDPDIFLSMRQVLALLNQGRILLDDDQAGFDFGRELDLMGHGLLGFALLGQRDYRALVNMIVQYLRVSLPIMDMQIECNGEDIRIRLVDAWELGDLRPFMTRVYMGSIHALASLVCRKFLFEFDFPAPRARLNDSMHRDGLQIHYGADHNQVMMPLSGREPRDDDANMARYLATARSREQLEADSSIKVVMQVRHQVLNQPGRDSTLERVAQRLSMSSRSIRRHLKIAGFSFSDIRNEIRQTYATRYLCDTSLPLDKIAEKLGYSDQASFNKAYRTWTGKTPGEVRRANRRVT
ncbi:helix-turn-helix domain-containing protein [Alcanivorax hongdengensis A-11-3]|uniref:Helix-turn-helix domain-containing protein n=2 Tax=Alcanivorax hongdengensis TaxID=519051 RepID=L0W9N9_9GAMM|nr:helix-turn-helix domain-containing protein [Alcanivorax hongdengensis A-11-3]